MLPASQFLQVSTCKKLGEIEAHVMTWAVLAILVQTARREFACCTSLGERLTTHNGLPPVFYKAFRILGCKRITLANKKLPQPE